MGNAGESKNAVIEGEAAMTHIRDASCAGGASSDLQASRSWSLKEKHKFA